MVVGRHWENLALVVDERDGWLGIDFVHLSILSSDEAPRMLGIDGCGHNQDRSDQHGAQSSSRVEWGN